MRSLGFVAVVLVVLASAGPARAQADPKFQYAGGDAKKETEVEASAWKSTAQAGFVLTSGNSRTTAFSGGAKASRLANRNKFSLDAAGAYARQERFIGVDANANGTIDDESEIEDQSATSTNQWGVVGRYDRFFTANDSAYATGKIGAERHAGKELLGGGQAGYSRQLFKSVTTAVVAEAGYDFQYEAYLGSDDSVSIHSARVFAGWEQKIRTDTGLALSAEALFNLNELDAPGGTVDPGQDTRVNGKAGLTTKLTDSISFGLTFTARFDNAPAPAPALGLPYAAGFVPLAEKLDTITEAQLIVNFL